MSTSYLFEFEVVIPQNFGTASGSREEINRRVAVYSHKGAVLNTILMKPKEVAHG